MSKSRILLIDGDMLVYRHATAVEKSHDWGDGVWSLVADADEAKHNLDLEIGRLRKRLKADASLIALSDPDENFRKSVYPPYKSNRAEKRKPLVWQALRDHVFENHDGRQKPALEADDMLGILATHPGMFPSFDERVIVSDDKDLVQIPVPVFSPSKGKDGKFQTELFGQLVSKRTRGLALFAQAMGGDTVDGYPGCPGIGPEKAMIALIDKQGWEPYEHTFKTGPRAGTTEQRWMKVEMGGPWQVVTSHFKKAGLTEADAVTQVNVARILQWDDFNYDTQEPILWTPPR